jgi:hypothetical protein
LLPAISGNQRNQRTWLKSLHEKGVFMRTAGKVLNKRRALAGPAIAAIALSVFLAACPQPADGPADSPPVITEPDKPDKPDKPADTFVPVTGISGVPTGGAKGVAIDLSGAKAAPDEATNKTIAWTLKDEGRTALSRGVDGNAYTPGASGKAVLTAAIKNGLAPGQDFTADFELAITEQHKPVTNITGAPQSGAVGAVIDLTGVIVAPEDASNRGALWTVAADSEAAAREVEPGKFEPVSGGTLKLIASISKGKSPTEDYTQTFTIAVALPLPAFSFIPTENSASGAEFDLAAWSGAGTARETWGLSAVEQPVVYFAVAKTAAQTITLGGAHAALVTQATSGTVDGSAAGPGLSVFTVDTSAFDLLFEGGGRTFTLTVSDGGKQEATVTVNLTIRPYKTGVAVFRVRRSPGPALSGTPTGAESEAWAAAGALERIPPDAIRPWDRGSNTVRPEGRGGSLMDAIAWVDANADTDGDEYLIRLEKDEKLHQMLLTCNGKAAVIRLRGLGQAWELTHDPTSNAARESNYWNKTYAGESVSTVWSDRQGLINLGGKAGDSLTLALENNITIYGGKFNSMVHAAYNTTLVTRKGSLLTGYQHSSSSPDYRKAVVYMDGGSKVRLEGGAIKNNAASGGIIGCGSLPALFGEGRFYKAASTPEHPVDLSGNACNGQAGFALFLGGGDGYWFPVPETMTNWGPLPAEG